MLGKIGGKREGDMRMRWLDGVTNRMDMKLKEIGEDKGTWHAVVHSILASCKESDLT